MSKIGRRLVAWGIAAACLAGGSSAHADALQNWSLRFKGPPPETLKSQWDVTFGNGLFVAVGHNGGDYGSIYTSPDGRAWTARHQTQFPGATLGELRRVIYANGQFVAVGWSYARYFSADGISWFGGLASSMGLSEGFRDVCFGQGKFVAIDGNYTYDNWVRTGLPKNGLIRIRYGNGRFVILGEPSSTGSTRVWSSGNGTSWSSTTLSSGPFLSGLAWGNGLFVAVGITNNIPYLPVIFTSPDGAEWTAREAGVTNQISSVECINRLFIATGDSVILTSTNGINWDSRTTTNRISRFAYGNGTLVGITGRPGFSYWGEDLLQSNPLLQLQINRETPTTLNVSGIVGRTVQIEAAGDVLGPWQTLDQFTLPTSPYPWTDSAPPALSNQFYRAVWMP